MRATKTSLAFHNFSVLVKKRWSCKISATHIIPVSRTAISCNRAKAWTTSACTLPQYL